jgi:hypothetical protein
MSSTYQVPIQDATIYGGAIRDEKQNSTAEPAGVVLPTSGAEALARESPAAAPPSGAGALSANDPQSFPLVVGAPKSQLHSEVDDHDDPFLKSDDEGMPDAVSLMGTPRVEMLEAIPEVDSREPSEDPIDADEDTATTDPEEDVADGGQTRRVSASAEAVVAIDSGEAVHAVEVADGHAVVEPEAAGQRLELAVKGDRHIFVHSAALNDVESEDEKRADTAQPSPSSQAMRDLEETVTSHPVPVEQSSTEPGEAAAAAGNTPAPAEELRSEQAVDADATWDPPSQDEVLQQPARTSEIKERLESALDADPATSGVDCITVCPPQPTANELSPSMKDVAGDGVFASGEEADPKAGGPETEAKSETQGKPSHDTNHPNSVTALLNDNPEGAPPDYEVEGQGEGVPNQTPEAEADAFADAEAEIDAHAAAAEAPSTTEPNSLTVSSTDSRPSAPVILTESTPDSQVLLEDLNSLVPLHEAAGETHASTISAEGKVDTKGSDKCPPVSEKVNQNPEEALPAGSSRECERSAAPASAELHKQPSSQEDLPAATSLQCTSRAHSRSLYPPDQDQDLVSVHFGSGSFKACHFPALAFCHISKSRGYWVIDHVLGLDSTPIN